MAMNNESYASYVRDGCGRCQRYQTPTCKVLPWTRTLDALRAHLLEAGLAEEMKWGAPCYTVDGKNVVMLAALADCVSLGFMKGAALDDPDEVLESSGPNSRIAKVMRFRSLDEVHQRAEQVRAMVARAITAERAGVQIPRDELPEPIPDALARCLDAHPELASAFEALTPGRKRSHILHVAGAKQAATRERRVDACAPKILAGRGFDER